MYITLCNTKHFRRHRHAARTSGLRRSRSLLVASAVAAGGAFWGASEVFVAPPLSVMLSVSLSVSSRSFRHSKSKRLDVQWPTPFSR